MPELDCQVIDAWVMCLKAIRIHKFGGPEVLKYEDVPTPEPGSGEIRIKVVAAGVNPADWKMRQGGMNLPLPMTMGLDVSGLVDAIGPQVEDFKVGERVFAKATAQQGGYAQYTVVNASQAAQMPRSIGFVEAAAIPTAGLAAWQALFDTAGLEKGQSVLIHAASGGVGSFAVQMAKWKGAYVIGTASGAHIKFVKDLGADLVIDYKAKRFENEVSGIDVVLDTIGGDTFERSWKVLKPGGFLVTLVENMPEGAGAAHGVHAKHIVTQPDGGELSQIASIIDEGKIKPAVTEVLPLADARAAQEKSEGHHAAGKIVLRVAEDPA